jgi:hypothetical protein
MAGNHIFEYQFPPQNWQHLQNQSSASWQARVRDDSASLDSKHALPANNIRSLETDSSHQMQNKKHFHFKTFHMKVVSRTA